MYLGTFIVFEEKYPPIQAYQALLICLLISSNFPLLRISTYIVIVAYKCGLGCYATFNLLEKQKCTRLQLDFLCAQPKQRNAIAMRFFQAASIQSLLFYLWGKRAIRAARTIFAKDRKKGRVERQQRKVYNEILKYDYYWQDVLNININRSEREMIDSYLRKFCREKDVTWTQYFSAQYVQDVNMT